MDQHRACSGPPATEKTTDRNSPEIWSLLVLPRSPDTQKIYRQTQQMCNKEEKEEVDQVREENNVLLSLLSTPEPVGAVIPRRNTNIEAWASSPSIFQFCRNPTEPAGPV